MERTTNTQERVGGFSFSSLGQDLGQDAAEAENKTR